MDSDTQRLGALKEANRIRSSRAQLKRELYHGDVQVTDLIRDPPEYIHTMKVLQLILATPHIGVVKAKRILGPHISIHKTVGDLTLHQRKYVVAKIRNARSNWGG